jgi:hypothetical protein
MLAPIKKVLVMRLLLLIFLFLSSFSYAQTDCTSANIGVYDSKGVLVSSHTQTYKANTAAILLAQQQGKATVKTPDIVCTSKVQSSSSVSSSSRSSSSARSSLAASSVPSSGGYYVSKSGSDNNPCTQNMPCASIQRGIDLLKAGDTLYIGQGTYTGQSNSCYFFGTYPTACVKSSGTPTAKISVIGDNAVIDGEGSKAGILMNAHDYWNFSGLKFVDSRKYAIANQSQAGNDVPNDALLSKGVIIDNCVVDTVTTNESGDNIGGFGPWSSQDWIIRNSTISNVTGGSGIRAYGLINALIENNTMTNVSEGILWKDHFVTAPRGLVFESTIRNNQIVANSFGIRIQIRGTGTPEAGHNIIQGNSISTTRADSEVISVAMSEARNQSGYLYIRDNDLSCSGVSGCAAISVDASQDLRITGNHLIAHIGISAIKKDAVKIARLTESDNNTFLTNYVAVMDRYGSTKNYRTLAEWKAAKDSESDTLTFDNPDRNSK